MADAVWKPVTQALERRRQNGDLPKFWLRDDDAIEPTAALDRLIATCEQSQIPLVLAVIPESTGEALARRLDRAINVSVAVHGWTHRNHAGPAEKKQELGPHRPLEIMLDELQAGYEKLALLYGQRFTPMLVPPWNRIDPRLVRQLETIGFQALSTFGPVTPGPILSINSNVDLIDWHGTRGCVEHSLLVKKIAELLEQPEPIGILGHHLVHDDAVWVFLEELFGATRAFDIEWLTGDELLRGSK